MTTLKKKKLKAKMIQKLTPLMLRISLIKVKMKCLNNLKVNLKSSSHNKKINNHNKLRQKRKKLSSQFKNHRKIKIKSKKVRIRKLKLTIPRLILLEIQVQKPRKSLNFLSRENKRNQLKPLNKRIQLHNFKHLVAQTNRKRNQMLC